MFFRHLTAKYNTKKMLGYNIKPSIYYCVDTAMTHQWSKTV